MTEDTVRVAALTAAAITPEPERRSGSHASVAAPQPPQKAVPAPVATLPHARAVEDAIAEVAKQIESYLRSVGRSLQFSVDNTTGRTIVTVRDSETGELIRQIPGEETLRLARALGSGPSVLVDLTA